MPTYCLGLDVHKVSTQYCLMDPAGEILREGSVATEEVVDAVPDADVRLCSRPRAAGPDPPAAFAELRRILCDDGRLVVGFSPRETMQALPVTKQSGRRELRSSQLA